VVVATSRGWHANDARAQIKGWYGGMGSFSDLVLARMNGHKVDPAQQPTINQRLKRLRLIDRASSPGDRRSERMRGPYERTTSLVYAKGTYYRGSKARKLSIGSLAAVMGPLRRAVDVANEALEASPQVGAHAHRRAFGAACAAGRARIRIESAAAF
jgi:hypothetical protein